MNPFVGAWLLLVSFAAGPYLVSRHLRFLSRKDPR